MLTHQDTAIGRRFKTRESRCPGTPQPREDLGMFPDLLEAVLAQIARRHRQIPARIHLALVREEA